LENRNKTKDAITLSTISSIKEHKIVIKCATINPDETTKKNKSLEKLWISPNSTIRGLINGTIIREPIILNKVPKIIQNWKQPIIVARHAYGDLWEAKEFECSKFNKAYLLIEKENGEQEKILIRDFKNESGIVLGCFNTDESIYNFAQFCFETALKKKIPLYLSTKNTILKMYDERYKQIFDEIYEKNFFEKFQNSNIIYEHKLIDDMVAFAVKSEGGFVWACKNHDGDVQSNFVIQGFGSLGLMSSAVYTKEGIVLCEAGHGTVTRHYNDYLKVIFKIFK